MRIPRPRRHRPDSLNALVAQARRRLAALDLPDRFTVDRLHEQIERYRGREVHLIPRALPPDGPHGLWIDRFRMAK